jgi:hypothetical protein
MTTTPKLSDSQIIRAANANGERLMRTEWVGTDGLIWTWQNTSNVMDTRNATYRTKRAALDAYAEYLRYA